MAITTWGPRVLEPGSSIFWRAVRDERPDLYKGYNPWDRINEPAALAAIALGSGYRSVIEQLDKVSRDRVKNATLDYICKRNVRSVETNAIYSIARKP
jgi:hypothetical protein